MSVNLLTYLLTSSVWFYLSLIHQNCFYLCVCVFHFSSLILCLCASLFSCDACKSCFRWCLFVLYLLSFIVSVLGKINMIWYDVVVIALMYPEYRKCLQSVRGTWLRFSTHSDFVVQQTATRFAGSGFSVAAAMELADAARIRKLP